MPPDPHAAVLDLYAELAELLCRALDGTDTARARYLVALISLRPDQDQDDDRARSRETTAPVFRPI